MFWSSWDENESLLFSLGNHLELETFMISLNPASLVLNSKLKVVIFKNIWWPPALFGPVPNFSHFFIWKPSLRITRICLNKCVMCWGGLGNLDSIHLEIASGLPMKNLKNLTLLMLNFGLIQTSFVWNFDFFRPVKEICTFFGPETNMQN